MLKTPKLRFKDKNGNAYPEWSSKQFDEVFEILQNNTFSRKELNYSNKSVKNIHYGDILINYPVNLNCQTCEIPNINQDINLSKYKSSSYLQNGDVIFADTAEDETVGKVCELYNVQEKMLSGLHTIPCRPKFNFASKYLGYFLNSNLYHNQLLPLITGIKVSSVSKSSIKTTEIYYPCLEEQEKITGFLSKVDELINECESEVKDLEEQKKGLMQKIFSQQIRFKDSNNNPYSDWKEKKLGDVSDIQRGGSPRPIENYLTDDINGINWIKIGDVSKDSNVINATKEKIKPEGKNKSRFVTKGDLLLSNSMSFGRPYILNVDGCIHDGWLVIRNYKKAFNTNFLCYILDSDLAKSQYKKLAAGGVVINLNKELVASTKFFVPCLEEQEKIAKVLSKMDELIEEKKALLSNWQQFKKGLLQQMFV